MAKRRRLRKKRVLLVSFLAVAVIVCTATVIFLKVNHDKQKKADPATAQKTDTEQLYYYDEALKSRYEAYRQEHPELTWEEVVWQVDAHLDEENYTNMKEIPSEHADDKVLLVNKHFRLADDYEPKELVLYNDYLYMTPETLAAFEEMAAAAALEDLSIRPGSTYRSVDYQRDLYNAYVEEDGQEETDQYSARPGSSEHHTGRAIDLIGPDGTLDSFEDTLESSWVHEHGYKYGFILRYKKDIENITGYMYEPWHITYVGVEAATTMHEENIASLEEYYVKYVMYQKESGEE